MDWKGIAGKTWVIVVAGLVLPPLGIILAWLKPEWSHRTKWIASSLMGLVLLGQFVGEKKKTAEQPSAEATATADADSPVAQAAAETAVPVSAEPPEADNHSAAAATERPRREPVREPPAEKEMSVASEMPAVRPPALPLNRNWFESDESYFTRGVAAVAKKEFSSDDAVCELTPASTPWKGFRGKVRLDDGQRLVEVHPAGSTFIVVYYTFSSWLGFPADFRDASGKAITPEDFCQRAYRKTPKQVGELFDAEKDKKQTAQSLWNLATNEAALRKRLPGRFTVEGSVFQVEKEYGTWHIRLFVHENERGVDRWIECLMKDGNGLDDVSKRSRVTIEGEFSRKLFAGPEMKNCTVIE
jgi:hypothetical protein